MTLAESIWLATGNDWMNRARGVRFGAFISLGALNGENNKAF
jgi:hypothetical protein